MSAENAGPSLPPELLVLVVEKLVEGGYRGHSLLSHVSFTLKQMCLTSHLLRDISQPYFFRSISLGDTATFPLDTKNDSDPLQVAERLENVFLLNPTVKTWVHHLYIRIPNRNEPTDSPVGKLAVIAERLFLQMERLTRLEIEHMVVTPKMHKRIYSLPELTEFRCWNVCYLDDPSLTPDAHLGLHIKHLTINEIHASSPLTAEIISQLALSPQLLHLHISTTISPFVYRLVIPPTNAVFYNLADFATTIARPSDLEALWRFLSACPNLSTLSVTGRAGVSSWGSGVGPAPPASLVPGLRHLRAPFAVAIIFGPQRSLESMSVTDASGQNLTKELLQTMPRTLQRLDLRNILWNSEESLDYLAELFPSLAELEVFFRNARRDARQTHMNSSLAETIRRLPHLKRLVLHQESETNDPAAQEAEEEFLEQLEIDTSTAPLCEVSLRNGVTWRRGRSGKWVC